jgi:AcrR family transcriptional regulator
MAQRLIDWLDAYLYYYFMPRPRSHDKRRAILEAATRAIVTHGLSAPTAGIAKEAGIPNGSLFTYFETKADLFNQLYLELKTEMASAAMKDFPEKAKLRDQAFHVWRNWMEFAVSFPEKRRTLAQLGVSEEITSATRVAAHKTMTGLADLMEQIRAKGPLRNVTMGFVGAIMNSLAEATMDFMIQDKANARKHCKIGFEACWRAMT